MSGITQGLIGSYGEQSIWLVTSTALAPKASDASQSLSVSSIAVNDMVVAITANRTGTAPTLLSGYTNILSVNSVAYTGNQRSFRLQYKKATSTSESITWTGAYGMLVVLRNANSIGSTNSNNPTGSTLLTTIPLPDLSSLNTSGKGYVLAGTYLCSAFTGTTSPYALIGSIAASVVKNTSGSLTSKTITTSNAHMAITFACEFLP